MKFTTGCVTVIAATLSFTAAAQNTEKAPERVAVRILQVKPDLVNEWSDTVKNEVLPVLKKAGVPWVSVSTAVFGPMAEFTVVMPVTKFAVFNDNVFVKTLGPEQGAQLLTKLNRTTEKNTLLIATAHPDLSITHEGPPLPAAIVTHYDVAPGRGMDFQNWLKNDLVPALRKAEVLHFEVYSDTFGAEISHYVSIQQLADLAELDKGSPLLRSLGQKGVQALLAKSASIVTHVERYVERIVPELSYAPVERAARAGQ